MGKKKWEDETLKPTLDKYPERKEAILDGRERLNVPEDVTFPAPIVPTVIFGVPVKLVAGTSVRLAPEPVKPPEKVVAVTTPDIVAPRGKSGPPDAFLLTNLSALILDIILETFYLFIGLMRSIILNIRFRFHD